MKAYPEYKFSGIYWLGIIPQHWDCVKTAWLFDQIGSGTTPTSGEDAFYKDGTVNWLQTGDLNDGIITETSKKVTEYAIKIKGLRLYPKGSLVIAMYGATIAKLGLLDIDTTVNQACCVLVKSKKVNSNFIFYFFQVAKKELISLASGGGQPNISQSTIYDFKVPVPPLVEQEAIAAYLDDVTGKVDALIAEKHKQVEDLRSYRTSLISETVIRGLDPNVSLRPSGIDWLGDIPEHWKTTKLKYVGEARNGLTYSPDNICDNDNGVLVLRSSNIQNDTLSFDDNVYVNKLMDDDLIMKEGDILICSRNGSVKLIGKCAIIPQNVYATFGAFMMRYRSNIHKQFTLYLIRTTLSHYRHQFATSTINQLTNAVLGDMQIPLPPLVEQQAIAEFLDEKTEKIDVLIRELEKQLEELAEYKKAVISEAVTGKVDVRDWKPQN